MFVSAPNSKPFVLVSCACQLGRPRTGCPGIWPNVIAGVSGKVLLDEMNSGAASLLRVGPIRAAEGLTTIKRLTPPMKKREFSCPTALLWDIVFFLPLVSDGIIGSSWVSNLLAFGLEFTRRAPGAPSLSTADLGGHQPLQPWEAVPQHTPPCRPEGSLTGEWTNPGILSNKKA